MNIENIREMFLNGILTEAEPVKGSDGRYHGVYVITNEINGKFYIGKHTSDKYNDGYFGSGIALDGAKEKYGEENFTIKYIHYSDSMELVDDHEDLVIGLILDELCDGSWAELNKICYNLRRNSGANYYSEETRNKMSKSHSGVPLSEKHKTSLSIALSGENNPFWGKSHSDESKQKMSINNTGDKHPLYGKTRSEETKRKIREALSGDNSKLKGKKLSIEHKQKISDGTLGKNAGIESVFFKGFCIGVNTTNFVILCGTKEMRARGYNQGHITQCILKNPRNKSHKGYTSWFRTIDKQEIIKLLETRSFADPESEAHFNNME